MPHFDHGYALLIGVGSLSYSRWSLPVTVRDAQAIAATLTDPTLCAYINDERHIRTRTDAGASRQAILDDMAWLAHEAQADPDATIVIYYSGHGWLDNTTGQYYLIQNDVNPARLQQSALSAARFTEAVRAIRSRRLLVLIDSCHAEGMATAKSTAAPVQAPGLAEDDLPPNFMPVAPPVTLTQALKQGEGRAVFTSSRGSQQSWVRADNAMSIFTYHLLEALQGAGNLPGAHEVRLSNIQNYLGRRVPQSAHDLYGVEQTPFFDMVAEDFAVALARGGKGLPAEGWTPDLIREPVPAPRITTVTGDHNVVVSGEMSNSAISVNSPPPASAPSANWRYPWTDEDRRR